MKIKYILEIIRSCPDTYGNTYCAFFFQSTETCNSVSGQMGSGSGENARAALYHLNGQKHVQNCHTTVNEIKIRDFNHLVKTWKFAGDSPEVLAKLMASVNDTTVSNKCIEA